MEFFPVIEADESEFAYRCDFFRVHKDGRIQKPSTVQLPPTDDLHTGLQSKDVLVSPGTGVSVRLFLPKIRDPAQKIPTFFYIHGGAFVYDSAFSPCYDAFVKALTSQANAIGVSVEYRLAPEHPLPACYEDAWAALRWAASHADGNGPETWLNSYADLDRVFVAGDSAGGNIAHTVLCRVGSIGLPGANVVGMILVHPYFGGAREEDDDMWLYLCPTNAGLQDPRMTPAAEDLAALGCGRMLMCLAGDDYMKGVGWDYCEKLKKSGWGGTVEILESPGEGHVFHLSNPTCENAEILRGKIASFVSRE